MTSATDLTPLQVARILEIVQGTDAILIGGQCLNFWAEHYKNNIPGFQDRGPFTSKDIDFFHSPAAAETLANHLNGVLYSPNLNDATPNSARVVGTLDQRTIDIDFMGAVLGVHDSAIKNNYITLRGRNPNNGQWIEILLLAPVDCLRSRLANINVLRRTDGFSVEQGELAVDVVDCYIAEAMGKGAERKAQAALSELEYITRDGFVRGEFARQFPNLNPLRVMQRYVDDERFDNRWREKTLAPKIARIRERLHNSN